jgi:hypothetical protein
MGDRAAILVAIVIIIIFPLPWYITVPLGILGHLWVRYLKYLDAMKPQRANKSQTETLPHSCDNTAHL